MAEPNPLTDPAYLQPPALSMDGMPQSLVIYGGIKDIGDYMGDLRVIGSPRKRPLPRDPEQVTFFRKVGRGLTTPLSLLASRFSPNTAPTAWEILSQQEEFSFQDVLRDQGFDDKESRWLGFTMDIIFDPLNYFSFFGLTKLGQLARQTSANKKLLQIAKKSFKELDGIDDVAELSKAWRTGDIIKGSKLQQRVALASAAGLDLEFGRTIWSQVSKSQRAFITLDIPFASQLKGIQVIPREVSMMAFAIPKGIRQFFVGAARHVPIPGKRSETLADLGAAMFRRGAGAPDLARKIDTIAVKIGKARDQKIHKEIIETLNKEVAGIDQKAWETIVSAYESRKAVDLTKSAFNTADLIKAGIPLKLARDKNVQKVLKTMKDKFAAVLKAEETNLLQVQRLGDPLNYVLHLVSEEGLEALGKTEVFSKTSRFWDENHGSMIQRLFRGRTIKTINDLARKKDGLFKGWKAIKGELFISDPVVLLATRMHRAAKSVTAAQYMTAMARAFGKKLPSRLPAGVIANSKKLARDLKRVTPLRREAFKLAGLEGERFVDAVASFRRVRIASLGRIGVPPGLLRTFNAAKKALSKATSDVKLKENGLSLIRADLKATQGALAKAVRDRTTKAQPGSLTTLERKVESLTERVTSQQGKLANSKAKMKQFQESFDAADKSLGRLKIAQAAQKTARGRARVQAGRVRGARERGFEKRLARVDELLSRETVIRDQLVPVAREIAQNNTIRKKAIEKLAGEGSIHTSASKYLEDFVFADKAVVKEIDQHFSKFSNIESVSDFFKYYDATLSMWKGITLAPFPAYHIRNYADNIWRNYLGGVNPMSYYWSRIGLGHFDNVAGFQQKRLNQLLTTARGERLTLNDFLTEATNLGVVGQNVRDAEFLVRNIEREVALHRAGRVSRFTKNLVNPRSSENSFVTLGFDFSRNIIEDPARFAHYIDRRLKGDNAVDAMFSVKKYLFDYEDLTQFERTVLRRVLPFYSFMRFNIPLQIERVLNRPGLVGKLFVTERSKIVPDILGRDDRDLEAKFLQEWVREGAPFFMGRNPDKPDEYRYLMLDGWMSTFDLNRLFDPGRYFLSNLSPILKEPLQLAANFDFFFQEPIVSMPNMPDGVFIRKDFLGISMPRAMVHVLRNIRAFNEIDRLIQIAGKDQNKALEMFKRISFGGSGILISKEKATRNISFRVRDIALKGRKEYLRALRRGRPKEAVQIQKATLAKIMRGGI